MTKPWLVTIYNADGSTRVQAAFRSRWGCRTAIKLALWLRLGHVLELKHIREGWET